MTRRLPDIILLEIALHSSEAFDLFLTDSSFAKFMTYEHNRRQVYSEEIHQDDKCVIIANKRLGKLHGRHIYVAHDGSQKCTFFTNNGGVKADHVYAVYEGVDTIVLVATVDFVVQDIRFLVTNLPSNWYGQHDRYTFCVVFEGGVDAFHYVSQYPDDITIADWDYHVDRNRHVQFQKRTRNLATGTMKPDGRCSFDKDYGMSEYGHYFKARYEYFPDHSRYIASFKQHYGNLIEKYRPGYYKKRESGCCIM